MSLPGAKISFRTKTQDCQQCEYRLEKIIPATNITVDFCTANLPKVVYQLRGRSVSRCNTYKRTGA